MEQCCETWSEQMAAVERRSAAQVEQLQRDYDAECSAFEAECAELACCRSAIEFAEWHCEELSSLSERDAAEHQQREACLQAQIAEMAAAQRCGGDELAKDQRRNYEEHIDWLMQQLRTEKRGYEDQIAKLRASEKRNEDRLLFLLQRQQCVKPESRRRSSQVACGC